MHWLNWLIPLLVGRDRGEIDRCDCEHCSSHTIRYHSVIANNLFIQQKYTAQRGASRAPREEIKVTTFPTPSDIDRYAVRILRKLPPAKQKGVRNGYILSPESVVTHVGIRFTSKRTEIVGSISSSTWVAKNASTIPRIVHAFCRKCVNATLEKIRVIRTRRPGRNADHSKDG